MRDTDIPQSCAVVLLQCYGVLLTVTHEELLSSHAHDWQVFCMHERRAQLELPLPAANKKQAFPVISRSKHGCLT